MKKTFLIILLAIPYFSRAADSLAVRKQLAFKTDLIAVPFPFIFEHEYYFSLTCEKTIYKKHTAQLQLWYGEVNEDYRAERVVQIVPQYKYYFGKQTKGFFGGVYFKYLRHKRKYYYQYDNYQIPDPLEELKYESVINSLAIGPLLGYEYNFKKHWVAEVIVGYGTKKNISVNTSAGYAGTYKDQTYDDAVLALNIGYRF